ncbi:MAG: hypothetical protein JXB05_01830 [Myxococcaceae bacterium]|nr:hypothetical protein [Myxococcaceae bacterium]
MNQRFPAILLVVLLMPWQVQAAAPPAKARAKPAGNPWVVILASKPQRAEAEAQLGPMVEARAFEWLKPAEGFPKVVESDSLPGLKPGLHVLVLGVCGSKEAALSARARVLPMVPEAYVKQLTGPATLACPAPINLASKLPKGAEPLASVPFEKEKALALTVHRVRQRSEMECETSDLLIRLVHGRDVLAETTLEGSCEGKCTPEAKEAGEAQRAEIQRRIEEDEGSSGELDYNFTQCMSLTPSFVATLGGLGRPTLVVSTQSLGHHDVIYTAVDLAGVGCGEIFMSRVSDPWDRGIPVDWYSPRIEIRPVAQGSDEERFGFFDGPAGEKVADAVWLGCRWGVTPPEP